jgi:hypothetical protein
MWGYLLAVWNLYPQLSPLIGGMSNVYQQLLTPTKRQHKSSEMLMATGFEWWLVVLAGSVNGAGTKIRTRDLLITNQLLYQLSYTGT